MPFFALILISTLCSVFGQLTLKSGMQRIARLQASSSVIVQIVTSPWVIVGLGIYGCGVLFWLMALSRLDVSFVYPFASLSYVGIIIGSHFLFKEHISRSRLIGILVIIAGVSVIGLSAGL